MNTNVTPKERAAIETLLHLTIKHLPRECCSSRSAGERAVNTISKWLEAHHE